MAKQSTTKGFSFKLYQKRIDGSYVVSLVIRFNKQRTIISLPFYAKPEQWDEKRGRYINDEQAKDYIKEKKLSTVDRKTYLNLLHPEREINNIYLDNKIVEIRNIVTDFEKRRVPFTNEMIKEKLFLNVKSKTVEEYLINHISELKTRGETNTSQTFEDLHSSIKRFDSKFNKILFADINYKYVTKFYDEQRKLGRKDNGIRVNLSALRSLLNRAIKDGVGSPETYPFSFQYGTYTGKEIFKITALTKEKTRKRFIPEDFLRKFYEYEFSSISHIRTKALFFFSFFCGGINYIDMAQIKHSDIKHGFSRDGKSIKYFTYKRSKTGEFIEIQINNDIQRQIDILSDITLGKPAKDYLLPIIFSPDINPNLLKQYLSDKRRKYNKYLKAMAKIMEFPIGIDDMTSYFARHSFAMTLYSKTKSIDLVSASLHHDSVETTKIYLQSFGKDEIAKVSCGLLD
ncbi:MAG: site-specific integrase [Prevotella sp.]|jgi:integrase|nr:site-specific integrase [Prevotella sp.]